MEVLTDEALDTQVCVRPSCQIRLEAAGDAGTDDDYFVIEIGGSIPGCVTAQTACVEVSIEDVTDGVAAIQLVLTKGQDGTANSFAPFLCQTELGTLPPQGIHLEGWTALVRIRTDWLILARSGRRSLLFHVNILAGPHKKKLTSTKSIIDYQNSSLGYVELRENLRTLRLGATALALASAEANRKPTRAQFNLIRQWAVNGLDLNEVSFWSRWRFRLALKRMARTVGRNNPGLQTLCQQIAQATPYAQRYDVITLCLQVQSARGSVNQEELDFIRQLAAWLQLDPERVRDMIDKILPIDLFEELDALTILGIGADMSQAQIRQHLNREYAKWNARVTHADPDIQTQAETMLDLIAQTRGEFVD